MATNFTTQSLQDLLSFPFKAPDGKKKLLIAGLIDLAGFIIPILPGLFLIGYGGLMMRRIIRENGEPVLPEWTEWNDMLVLGLKLGAAGFIYSFPALAIMMLGYMGMLIPAFVEMISGADRYQSFAPMIGIQLAGSFGGLACFGLGMLFFIAAAAVLPPVLAHVAATNSFASAFRVREWWKIFRANMGGFVVAMILTAGLYMVMVLASQILYFTIVLCILIPFLFAFVFAYLLIIADVLFAQAYKEATEKLAVPVG